MKVAMIIVLNYSLYMLLIDKGFVNEYLKFKNSRRVGLKTVVVASQNQHTNSGSQVSSHTIVRSLSDKNIGCPGRGVVKKESLLWGPSKLMMQVLLIAFHLLLTPRPLNRFLIAFVNVDQ